MEDVKTVSVPTKKGDVAQKIKNCASKDKIIRKTEKAFPHSMT